MNVGTARFYACAAYVRPASIASWVATEDGHTQDNFLGHGVDELRACSLFSRKGK